MLSVLTLTGILAGSIMLLTVSRVWAGGSIYPLSKIGSVPPIPLGFQPSNARTTDGKLIPENEFFRADRCAKCHQDTHQAWSESLHRNAGREPFYKESVDLLQQTRGIEFARHCESCHAPVALLSGALTTGSRVPRQMDDEGVTCTVCHSITETRVDGTGSYTIRRPALLARADGTPVFGDVPDAAIMADVASHKRAMMRPLLKTAEFCAACHKSSAPPALNNYKYLRGFSTYDEWQQSGASGQTVTPFYRRPNSIDCRGCHMPKVTSLSDLSAKDELISSHRWLGANTLTPQFYGQTTQVKLTEEFLKAQVLSVDIFAVKNEASGQTLAPLVQASGNTLKLQPGTELTAEVVVFNRKAAHSFPPELRDMYEPWVEFEVLDSAGKTIFHSGFIKPDGTLDERAHVYKSLLLDESSRVITRHQVWQSAIKAYDNAIPPGRSDLVRYRFRVPENFKADAAVSLTLRARVNYRRFIQEYTQYVLHRQEVSHLLIPIVRMAEAEVQLTNQTSTAANQPPERKAGSMSEAQSRRWNDYGIGLLEQTQYGAASEAFRRASVLNPKDPDPLISAAIAEMKTERFGPEQEQLKKAAPLLDAALKLNPTLARARFYRAILLRSEGKANEAADELSKLAAEHSRDREVQRQLGQTLYMLGRIAEAQTAFEAINNIDPTDAGAYQFLSPIYASEGHQAESDIAHSFYLLWRDDPLAEAIAARFFTMNPNWADERVWNHTHGESSPARPTLTGNLASP
jgi:Flp pilus assembly protein TadD